MNDDYTATYSPEDNKLRLYAFHRLDEELYSRVKKAGFRWAPKQDLFFAHWSPKAEDILLELAGEIGDEDTSLVDRAEKRAERFENYSDKRANDAQTAYDSAKAISDEIPMGQPILVGHHSEKKARKDAEKIERGLQKAVSMWETSEYWKHRANGAIRSAKYKERPDVRARRIKTIEAENRKYKSYFTPCPKTAPIMQRDYNDENYPDCEPVEYRWCGKGRGGNWVKTSRLAGIEAYYSRHIKHNENRLKYEYAMLNEQGGLDLLKPKARPKQPPLLNYLAPEGINIENKYHRGSFSIYPQLHMTKAEYSSINRDYKGTNLVNGHRVRVAMRNIDGKLGQYCIFLTDSKVHEQPEAIENA